MILVKIHKSPNGNVIAVCDKNIIGKTFEDKGLRITASKEFYEGNEIKDKNELLKILKNSGNINILGKESVDFAVKNNIIEESSIIRIKKIPYAMKISI